MMPIDLVLVRHGQSEGNLANQFSYADDKRGFTEAFKARPSSSWRLTDLGIEQSEAAGVWIRANVFHKHDLDMPLTEFDRSYVSFYVRAMETAAHLGLGGRWLMELYLRELDWGQLDVMSQAERWANFEREMKRRERDGLYWAPPGGESMAHGSLRVDRILHTLHRECSDKQVGIVCHGQIMRLFQLRIERVPFPEFIKLAATENDVDKIHNGQILHYTRRDPQTSSLGSYMEFVRSVCPWDFSKSTNEWRRIKRQNYSADDLLKIVEGYPRIWGKPEDLKGDNE